MKIYTIFRNKGVLDPRSISTFGVSSKEGAGAIGYFGTGLKYAIAILLREGQEVTIQSGGEIFNFSTRREVIRKDEFDLVLMNGEPLGFTTELGKNWELWQACRELYCNCKDEGGEVDGAYAPEHLAFSPDETAVIVQGEEFADVWTSREKFLLLDSKPLAEIGDILELHPGPSEHVFYRGIRAHTLSEPSVFTYNIKRKMDLTEDRTLKYFFDTSNVIRLGVVAKLTDADLIEKAVTAPKGTFEHDFDWRGIMPGDTFIGKVSELVRAFSSTLNKSAADAIRVFQLDQLTEAKPAELSDVDRQRLERAVTFCESLGYPVREYPFTVTDFLGDGVLGMAHKGRIYLSTRVFMMGTKMLAGTILEEFIHLRHGLLDNSRSMQNFLVDAVVTMGERITGEPL